MTTRAKVFHLLLGVSLCLSLAAPAAEADDVHAWSSGETAVLRSLWIGSLPPMPPDPSNAYADDPRAAALGRNLFHDARFSGNLRVSCLTCHRADMNFTDGLPRAHGMGTTDRRSMPLIGMAYGSWFFWDGRKDSLWAQALGPIENPVEHGFSRTMCVFVISRHYRQEYEEIFGPLPDNPEDRWPGIARPAPDNLAALKAWVVLPEEEKAEINRIYVNMGKAIAAFVRTIVPGPAPFDRYVEALLKGDTGTIERTLTPKQVAGLRLFIGKAKCTNCHNGPLFTNGEFHNVGVPHSVADRGRADGIRQVLQDEFNCLSVHSDASPKDCAQLRFLDTETDKYIGAFKTPTLRNVADRPPYMDAGQFSTLREVLEFYREAESPDLGHTGLTDEELEQLEAFLHTLSGPLIHESL